MKRYNRQVISIGKKAQNKLSKAYVCVVGVGALGTAVAQSLVRAGVGKIKIIDFDVVRLDNLQRQQLFNEKDVGKAKVKAAKTHLMKINSEVEVEEIKDAIDELNLGSLKSDLVLDCCDNFETSYVISDYCKKNKIPLVFGSAIRLQGYVYNQISGNTVRKIFRSVPSFERCRDVGVMNTITSVIGSIQANEAIKVLTGENYEKKLMRFDLKNNELLKIKV